MALTERFIKSIELSGKTQRHWDSGGLYLEVSPKGGKWWRFKYRFCGKERRISLGVYHARDVNLRVARLRRDEARRLLSNGIDPSEHRKQAKRAITLQSDESFEAIAREWLGKQANKWTESTYERSRNRLEAHIFPWLGSMPLAT